MPKLTYVLSLHGGLAMGGLEIQANRTASEMRKLGWDVEFLSSETRDIGDLVHFFGTYDSYWDVAMRVRERGVPYVISPVFLPPTYGWKLGPRGLRKRVFDRTSHRNQRKTLDNSARILVLSQTEASALDRYYGDAKSPTVVVPNGIDDRFFTARPDEFRQHFGVEEPFVLCTGRIEPRKNQLALARAAHLSGVACLFLGSEQDSAYVAACSKEGGPYVRFLGEVDPGSDLLPSACSAATVFALVSFTEVLSLSALEAAAGGARLVLSNSWGAEEHFKEHAAYVSPKNIQEISDALTRAMALGRNESQVGFFEREYRWSSVAKKLEGVYREVLG